MSRHLDYAAENFREAWSQATDDPSTIEALTRGGRALVRVARELEDSAIQLEQLRREVQQLRSERENVGRRAILIVRDSGRTTPAAIADQGVEIVELDLHAVGGRDGFMQLPTAERTAWLARTDAQIAAMPEGRAQAAAARIWREYSLASTQADAAAPAADRRLERPPTTERDPGL